MTDQEQNAIDWIKIVRGTACTGRVEKADTIIKGFDELEKYRAIGTIDQFKKLAEKQTTKRPVQNDLCTCPSCGLHNDVIKMRRHIFPSDIVYCFECGQALKIFRSDEQNIDVT